MKQPFPSKNTKSSLTFGQITNKLPLIIKSQTAENGVIFSDGIEKDFLDFNAGTKAEITIADKTGNLVI